MVILMDYAYLFEFVDDLIEEIDLTRMKMFLIRNNKSQCAYIVLGDCMVLFSFNVTTELFYLTIMLLVISYGIKNLEFIDNRFILLYLLIISVLVNFIFNGISTCTLFESIVSVSLVVLIQEIYKKIKKIFVL